MTETVYLYVTDTMADWEPGYAIAAINTPDHQRQPGRYAVATVGADRTPIRTQGGVTIVPDTTFDDLDLDQVALLILPGSNSWDDIDRHAGAITATRTLLAAGTPVAAICGATFGLALAGILDERAHTSNAAVYLEQSGYAGGDRFVEARAVTDGPLITASGTAPVDFAAEIFAALDLYAPEVLAAWKGLYTTGELEHFLTFSAA